MNTTKRLVLASLLLALTATVWAGTPKYIFYFIGDGMGMAPVMATQTYKRMVQNNEQLLMTTFPTASWVQTYSASSPVTDSAAAGTALATGHKTKNGMLGMDADTVAVEAISVKLQRMGYGIGIVTSGAADDATPGAFYTHVPNRGMYYEIGKDAAYCGFDFIAGAGLRGTKKKDGTPNDLYDVLEQSGVQILRGAKGAAEASTSGSKRIMLLNPEGYSDPNEFGFQVDGVGADGVGLTLEIALDACIKHLEKKSPDKFFVMCEGAQIDHALHGNDGAGAIGEILDLDRCIGMAYDFYLKHKDETLIIVTADHDTGGMSVGCSYTGYNAIPKYFDYAKISKNALSAYCENLLKNNSDITWDEMKKLLSEKLGLWTEIKVKDTDTKALEQAFNESFIERKDVAEKGLYSTCMGFASKVFRVYNNCSGWGFTTGNHTGNPVPVFAVGVGADRFNHVLNNIEIAPAIMEAVGE